MILIGFMGSGKTTIGTMLANQRNVPFIDLDEYIVKQTGQSIPEIFDAIGEIGFREREFEALDSCINKDAIISTGGGIVTYDKSYIRLKNTNRKIIYLETPFDISYNRIKNDTNRPLVQMEKEKLKVIYESRLNLYQTLADCAINTEQTKSEIVHEINKIK